MITLAGESICIITSPQDLAFIYKNNASVQWDSFVRELNSWIGVSPSSLDRMWREPAKAFKLGITKSQVKARHSQAMIEEFHHEQLLPGENLDKLSEDLNLLISSTLTWESIQVDKPRFVLKINQESVTVSLWSLCANTFINSLTEVYYGNTLLDIDPDLVTPYVSWESTNWNMYQVPRFLSNDMHIAKEKIISSFTAYFNLNEGERRGMSGFFEAVEDELRASGLSNEEIARVNMLHYWV